MKMFILAFTLAASVATTSSFANDVIKAAPGQVVRSFESAYADAKNVTWSTTEDLYKAQFTLNNQSVQVYYDSEGTQVALTRHVNFHQMPLALQTTIKNDYKDVWIADVLEFSSEEGTRYFVTIEDTKKTVVLKSSALGWSVFQKTRKK